MSQSTFVCSVKWLNSSILPMDKSLSGTTIPGQSGPGSNSYEGVLQIPKALGP